MTLPVTMRFVDLPSHGGPDVMQLSEVRCRLHVPEKFS